MEKKCSYLSNKNDFKINSVTKMEQGNLLNKEENWLRNKYVDPKNFNYYKILEKNKIDLREVNFGLYKSTKINKENIIVKKITKKQKYLKKKGIEFQNFKKLYYNNFLFGLSNKENKNMIDFNNNLYLINIIKNENLIHFKKEILEKDYENIVKNLENTNYFSNILENVSKNNSKEDFDVTIEIKKDKVSDNKNIRYIKSKDDMRILKDYFKYNTFIWSKNLINEFSKKLGLSEKCIYKWNWNELKKHKNRFNIK